MRKLESITGLDALRHELQEERKRNPVTMIIPNGTCCQASQSATVIDAVRRELVRLGLDKKVRLRLSGCLGFCEQEPMIVFEADNLLYCRVAPADAAEIVARTVRDGETLERLLYLDPVTGKRARTEADIRFYQGQDRQLLAGNRQVDPRSLDDYIAVGGYTALAKVLAGVKPTQVIKEITAAGLQGRGGGGFLTGRKWVECAEAPGDEKYVICNADEGDPGAYMDRCLLEANPHLVMEGMMIGAWAVGAGRGYIYVRNEYPLAVQHARIAAAQARHAGLLGEGILGSDFSFDLEIARGGGAFVCGESTALMASLEGKVGEPRAKDVHTAKEGLWNMPTVLNNVETWANVPAILAKGASWFAGTGTKTSKGTKIFALTGQVKNTGLVEVAMGTPLERIIFDIGGGTKDGKAIKAVQTGGPSGGCLPANKFSLPVDFDTLRAAGSMMGSGGMVVMDEATCMVDVAKYFLGFLQEESCGKCVPCRVGIDRMREIVTDITEGRGTKAQIELLGDLAETVSETSLCALGKTAANPVLSTLRYFPEEYAAHVEDRKCPAGVCRELIVYSIDAEKCNGCGSCLRACPHEAIRGKKKTVHVIEEELCSRCGICRSECQFGAIKVN